MASIKATTRKTSLTWMWSFRCFFTWIHFDFMSKFFQVFTFWFFFFHWRSLFFHCLNFFNNYFEKKFLANACFSFFAQEYSLAQILSYFKGRLVLFVSFFFFLGPFPRRDIYRGLLNKRLRMYFFLMTPAGIPLLF